MKIVAADLEECMMRMVLFVGRMIALVMIVASAGHAATWQPPAGLAQIPLWPPDAKATNPQAKGEESATPGPSLVAGRPWTVVANVARPTMTVFPAKGTNTGAAVVVFPGGGYHILAIDLEGTEVCDWLVEKGVTCVVLKYRVPGSGPYGLTFPRVPTALRDAQRTIGLLRARASEWGIDPHKIGVLGFSAGGHLVAAVSNASARRYKAVDAADRQDIRPDFAVVLYPGHLWNGNNVEKLAGGIKASAKTPPTFILQAQDDPVDDIHESLSYYYALLEANAPVEMHVYAHGGHAFGLRRTAQPITQWPGLAETWLRTIGILPVAPDSVK
jgi:acetyl esterase/lipase